MNSSEAHRLFFPAWRGEVWAGSSKTLWLLWNVLSRANLIQGLGKKLTEPGNCI